MTHKSKPFRLAHQAPISGFSGANLLKWYCASRYSEKVRVWAPNYYDVICFDAEQLETRERYIRANPRRWALKSVPTGTLKNSCYNPSFAVRW